MDIESAKKMYIEAKKSENLEPVGIHFHIGSQLTDLRPIAEASKEVADLARSLQALKIDLKFFDVGGGIGIKYGDEKTIELYNYAQEILKSMRGLDMTIVCEPGRFIVGNSGYFLTKVLYEKRNIKKRFVIVDGAMNDLIRPTLYGAYHKIEALKNDKAESSKDGKSGEESLCDVVGPICESGDYLAKNVNLPPLTKEDYLIVYSSGAYGSSMSSNYNSRLKAEEVAVDGDRIITIKRREVFEDTIRDEKMLLEESSKN